MDRNNLNELIRDRYALEMDWIEPQQRTPIDHNGLEIDYKG